MKLISEIPNNFFYGPKEPPEEPEANPVYCDGCDRAIEGKLTAMLGGERLCE